MGYTRAERARYDRGGLLVGTTYGHPKTLNPKLLVARANVRQHRALRDPGVQGYKRGSRVQGSLGSGKFYSSQYLQGSKVPWVPGNLTVPSTSRVPGFPGFREFLQFPVPPRVPGFPGFREILQFPVPPGFHGSLGSGKFYSSQYLQALQGSLGSGKFTVPSTSRVPGFPGFREGSLGSGKFLQFPVPPGFPGFREILQFPRTSKGSRVPWVPGKTNSSQYLQGSRVPWVPGNFTVSRGTCWQANKVLGVVDLKENRINSKLSNSCNSNSCNSKHKEGIDLDDNLCCRTLNPKP